tara:strand:- start:4401 stop:5219 length:819 start_codon:yes stop_codon:yes gene_type:complete
MEIGIIGYGFVGKAVSFGFSHPEVVQTIVDPKLDKPIKNAKNVDFAFIAVPTPFGDNGEINSTIVEETVAWMLKNTEAIVILKSTVTPDVIDQLMSLPGAKSRMVYNPEFLTEKAANEDFVNPELHVFGGKKATTQAVAELYHNYSSCKPCPIKFMTAKEASFVKYGINSFLASKVLWFNQFFDCVENNGGKFNTVLNAMLSDPRIGSSHTSVPGFDGKRGYGGACFPKDTNAFYNFDKSFTVLRETISVNNALRSAYDKDERELEQNVNYG